MHNFYMNNLIIVTVVSTLFSQRSVKIEQKGPKTSFNKNVEVKYFLYRNR